MIRVLALFGSIIALVFANLSFATRMNKKVEIVSANKNVNEIETDEAMNCVGEL